MLLYKLRHEGFVKTNYVCYDNGQPLSKIAATNHQKKVFITDIRFIKCCGWNILQFSWLP